jgi:LysR family hydrogen peroxide-inducible transcriptional activator
MRNDLDLHLVQHFVVLARTKNFTRAAEELHLSQSALSRAIQRLEDQLGQPLFERRPRELVLTELGALLLNRAKDILKLMEDTFSELAEASRRGRVRLGAIPTIAPYFLPGLLATFAQKHPEISVIVQEDTTDALIRRCTQGELDLVILAQPVIARQLEVEPLFEEELHLLLPLGHPLESKKQITASSVDGFPFVVLNEAHCLSEHVAAFCRKHSVQPVTVERTSQLATVQELVALRHGVSIVPEMARKVDASDQRVYRTFTGNKPVRTIAMMWNPDRFLSQATQALMQHLRLQNKTRKADRSG